MIRAIIIDDEASAREGLQLNLQQHCPQVQVVAVCGDPQEAIRQITTLEPELVFLDIQMPTMSGFELLEQIKPINFEVIFVTSYHKYAIKAIKFSALDYLLKPIDVDDLKGAVNRVQDKRSEEKQYQALLTNMQQLQGKPTRLAIPTEREIVLQKLMDIRFCAADGSYCHVHTADGSTITVAKNLKDFEQILPAEDFYRIHHSTIVNINHVQKYVRGEGGYVVLNNDQHLDVARRRKEGLMNLLNKL